ncbi:hypothetical protein FJZ31_27155 [Candidatus Poribacteria bacterium]|nr:hypothetical protein [Candidatus Poribacteria bacterium]
MSQEKKLPQISTKTEFGYLESKDNVLLVKVTKASKHIAFEGPKALLKTATFVNGNHLLDVVQDGTTITLDAPPFDNQNVNWDFELAFEPAEKPLGKSTSYQQACILLPAGLATMHGEKVMYETAQIRDYIGFWVNPADYVSWDFSVEKAGDYLVEMTVGCAPGQAGSTYAVEMGDAKLTGKVRATGNWRTFTIEQPGILKLKAGQQTLIVRPVEIAKGALMNLKRIELRQVHP